MVLMLLNMYIYTHLLIFPRPLDLSLMHQIANFSVTVLKGATPTQLFFSLNLFLAHAVIYLAISCI